MRKRKGRGVALGEWEGAEMGMRVSGTKRVSRRKVVGSWEGERDGRKGVEC